MNITARLHWRIATAPRQLHFFALLIDAFVQLIADDPYLSVSGGQITGRFISFEIAGYDHVLHRADLRLVADHVWHAIGRGEMDVSVFVSEDGRAELRLSNVPLTDPDVVRPPIFQEWIRVRK